MEIFGTQQSILQENENRWVGFSAGFSTERWYKADFFFGDFFFVDYYLADPIAKHHDTRRPCEADFFSVGLFHAKEGSILANFFDDVAEWKDFVLGMGGGILASFFDYQGV